MPSAGSRSTHTDPSSGCSRAMVRPRPHKADAATETSAGSPSIDCAPRVTSQRCGGTPALPARVFTRCSALAQLRVIAAPGPSTPRPSGSDSRAQRWTTPLIASRASSRKSVSKSSRWLALAVREPSALRANASRGQTLTQREPPCSSDVATASPTPPASIRTTQVPTSGGSFAGVASAGQRTS